MFSVNKAFLHVDDKSAANPSVLRLHYQIFPVYDMISKLI